MSIFKSASTTQATTHTTHGNFIDNVDGNLDGMTPLIMDDARAPLHLQSVRVQPCFIMDIITRLDSIAKDGVDMLSFSIDSYLGTQFNYNPIAIATFKAMEPDIFVSCATSSTGPKLGTTGNGALWMPTIVAGSSMVSPCSSQRTTPLQTHSRWCTVYLAHATSTRATTAACCMALTLRWLVKGN
jgi:hypothetical protein